MNAVLASICACTAVLAALFIGGKENYQDVPSEIAD
jgi:hypothetical protein